MQVKSTSDEFRQLDTALFKGEIDLSEFKTQRRLIKDSVEDAVEVVDTTSARVPSPHEMPSTGRIASFFLVVVALMTLFGYWLFSDWLLALTISVTCLAAFTVHAFKNLDD